MQRQQAAWVEGHSGGQSRPGGSCSRQAGQVQQGAAAEAAEAVGASSAAAGRVPAASHRTCHRLTCARLIGVAASAGQVRKATDKVTCKARAQYHAGNSCCWHGSNCAWPHVCSAPVLASISTHSSLLSVRVYTTASRTVPGKPCQKQLVTVAAEWTYTASWQEQTNAGRAAQIWDQTCSALHCCHKHVFELKMRQPFVEAKPVPAVAAALPRV